MTVTLPILPDPEAPHPTRRLAGRDHTGAAVEISVVKERPLTIFLNAQEVVTAMTIGDYPEYPARGFLRKQGMLRDDDAITGVDHDSEVEAVVVRTAARTTHEEKVRKKTRTSGCAVGTVFGDMMEGFEGPTLPPAAVRTSWIHALARQINTTPSLYLAAGAIHGTVLRERDRPLVDMEDVGRHNAVDKIAGWMLPPGVGRADKDPPYYRAPDVRDGDQDGADGDPLPRLALRFHRLGGRDCAQGGADTDRADARRAVRLPCGRGKADARRRSGGRAGEDRRHRRKGAGDCGDD